MKRSIDVFATENDWSAILTSVALKRSLGLVEAGLFDDPAIEMLEISTNLEAFKSYLIINRDHAVAVRNVPQRLGGEKFAIDQLANPDSVMLVIGGMIGENRLVSGQISTVAAESNSTELYAEFTKAIRTQFEKIKSYYVGPEASRLLDAGGRLTPTRKSPKEYDLVR